MAIPPRLASSLRWLSEPRARKVVPLLALFIGLFFLSGWTSFRTTLVFENRGGQLSLSANGRRVQAPGRILSVDRILIRAFDSVYPMGGETLRIRQGERFLLDDRLPDRFRIERGRYTPLGDWYLDPHAASGTVYEKAVAVTGDFELEATFKGRCSEWTSIVLEGDPAAMLQFRRGLMNNDFALTAGGRILAGGALVSPRSEMARNALDILVRAAMAGCALVLGFALLRWIFGGRPDGSGALPGRAVAVAVGFVVLAAFLLQLWVSNGILEGLAHTPDEVSYMVQAKWLVANKLYQPPPPMPEQLTPPFTYVREGKWFGTYPVGWPLLLAVGQALGVPGAVGPTLGALYVLVVFLIGKELYGELVGLGAAVLAALSPMAILMFASFLSHGAAALLIALFLWLFLVARRRGQLWLFALSGASLGYAFAIRPMTAIAVGVPLTLFLLWELSRTGRTAHGLERYAAFVSGGIVGALPALIANQLTTGNAFVFGYSWGAQAFFSLQNLDSGLLYLDATAASSLPALFGWGWGLLSGWGILALALAFACVPFLIRRPGRFDLLLAGIVLALPLSFLTWRFHGLHGYGPRFYFEAFLALYLLTAYGFALLAGVESERGRIRFRSGGRIAAVSLALFLLLTLSTALTLAPRMRLYRGYNWVNGALPDAIERANVRRGLILFPDGSDWFPWGAASRLLPADLRDDLVFARSRPDNSQLLAIYRDRPAYQWRGTLVPVARSSGGGPALPPSFPVPGLTTLLGWWLALALGVTGALFGIVRLSRRRTDPAPALSGTAPESLRALEGAPDRQTRFLGRKLAAVAGIGIAYAGQNLLTSGQLVNWLFRAGVRLSNPFRLGWILLLAGAILFAAAWRRLDSDGIGFSDSADASPGGTLESRRGRGSGAPLPRVLAAAAVLLTFLNCWDWTRHGETVRTRLFWGLSAILFLSALAIFDGLRRAPRPRDDLSRFPTVGILTLIVGVAFVLRFVALTTVPLDVHGDFATIGLGAHDILQGRTALFATGEWGLPWATYLPSALSMGLFGEGLFGARMAGVIAGTATVLGVYLLASMLFTRSVALLAAAVSAVGYTEIHFSRVGTYIDPVPWMLFGIYFLVRGLRSGRLFDFGLSGALLAVGFEMYFSGRLVVLMLLLYFAYLAFFHRATLRARWRGWGVLLLAGIIVTGPLIPYYWRNFYAFMLRTHQVWIFTPDNMRHLLNKYGADGPAGVLFEQAWRSLLTFNYTSDSSTQFGFRHPMLNPALAPLFVLGAALAASRLRRPAYALLWIWLGTGVVLGSILTIDAPFWPRLVVLLPAVAILTAVGVRAAFRAILSIFPDLDRPWLVLALASVVLFLIGRQNWQWYFYGEPRLHVAPITWVSRQIEATPPGTSFCMLRDPLSFADRVPRFLITRHHSVRDVHQAEFETQKARCLAEGRAWVLIPPFHDWVLDSLNRSRPGGRLERFVYPRGDPGPIFWYPPGGAAGSPVAP